jgi:hypothetical protein
VVVSAAVNLANIAVSFAPVPAAADALSFVQKVFGSSAAAQQQPYAVQVTCLKSWLWAVDSQQQQQQQQQQQWKESLMLVALGAASAVGSLANICSAVLHHLYGGPLVTCW